jgi:4-hydroxybenzoyl-CoA thioesterase
MTFVHEITVRFGEIDQARVVYYPVFFHYLHQTFEEWFEQALGVPYKRLVVDENIGLPSVRVETEFRRPLPYGERVRVELRLVNVGTRSITVEYHVVRMSDGETSARARVTTVAVDNDTFRSMPIPPHWRERFERFMNAR